MKKIAIICCYFGKLRFDYKTWLMSCSYNDTIDWLLFTDCNWGNVPNNVKIINLSFEELKTNVQKCFDFDICLEKPYKICDYRPAFGYIFSNYLKDYNFWGYCDFDMIFGNIRKFVTDDILENYEKIYTRGHLSLYKNNEKINNLFKSNLGKMNYRDVFTTNISKVFDEEEGIYDIFLKNNCKVYDRYEYIDLCKFSKELINNTYTLLKNYKYQTIIFDNGKVEFVYTQNRNITKKEVVYVHYSGKNFDNNGLKKFQITSKGIEKIDESNYFKYDNNNLFCIKIKISIKKFLFRLNRKIKKVRMKLIEKYKRR
jgi:hypothetical protein